MYKIYYTNRMKKDVKLMKRGGKALLPPLEIALPSACNHTPVFGIYKGMIACMIQTQGI